MDLATSALSHPYLADPARFACKFSRGNFRRFRHIDYLSGLIASDVAKGGTRRIVTTPPQVGKSTLFARWLPAWLIELDPTRRILDVSYAADLAGRSVRAVRNDLQEFAPQLRVRLGKSTEEYFETTMGGYVKASGIGGGITGWGFTDVVIDDPYANPEQAFSPTYRAKIMEDFDAVISTRLALGANIWIIQTRWHDEDLAGVKAADGSWLVTRLPAFADENDPIGRAVGDVLCPALHTAAEWTALRDGPAGDGRGAMASRIWRALYDARPTRDGSGLFSRAWVQVLPAAPALHSARVRYWDLAASKTRTTRNKATDRDYAVGTLEMRDREQRYVVEHVERLRGTAQDVDNAIIGCAERDGRSVRIVIEKEPGSNGEMYASYLTRRLAGWSVTFKPSTGSKETRFRPFAAQCQAGNVSIVRAPWNAAWLDELEVAFVGGSHDDQADSAAGAFAELCQGNAWPWIVPGRSGSIPPNADPMHPSSHDEDKPRPSRVIASGGGMLAYAAGIRRGGVR